MANHTIVLRKEIGQLYPVLKDARGRVIDGLHRKASSKEWREERLPQIDSEEKYLIARLLANDNRRIVPEQEIAEVMNGLAAIHKKEGVPRGEITEKVAEATGYSRTRVEALLRAEYKRPYHETPIPRVSTDKTVGAIESTAEQIVKTIRGVARDPDLTPQDKEFILAEVRKQTRTGLPDAIVSHVKLVKQLNRSGETSPQRTVVLVKGQWTLDNLRRATENFLLTNWKTAKELSPQQKRDARTLLVHVEDHARAWLRAIDSTQEVN
jgi:hypothetical protein